MSGVRFEGFSSRKIAFELLADLGISRSQPPAAAFGHDVAWTIEHDASQSETFSKRFPRDDVQKGLLHACSEGMVCQPGLLKDKTDVVLPAVVRQIHP